MEMHFLWLIAGVIGIILELIIPGLIIIFFGCGALVTGILSWIIPMGLKWQLFIFLTSSVASFFAFRSTLKDKFFAKDNSLVDELSDEYIGKEAIALQDFSRGTGKVEFKGAPWLAISNDDIRQGDTVIITKRESIKLTVKNKTILITETL